MRFHPILLSKLHISELQLLSVSLLDIFEANRQLGPKFCGEVALLRGEYDNLLALLAKGSLKPLTAKKQQALRQLKTDVVTLRRLLRLHAGSRNAEQSAAAKQVLVVFRSRQARYVERLGMLELLSAVEAILAQCRGVEGFRTFFDEVEAQPYLTAVEESYTQLWAAMQEHSNVAVAQKRAESPYAASRRLAARLGTTMRLVEAIYRVTEEASCVALINRCNPYLQDQAKEQKARRTRARHRREKAAKLHEAATSA